MSSAPRGRVRVGSVIGYAIQVVIALALPIAFCAYAPASALTWAGVIIIALLGFALLHGGWAWLVPVSGAIAMLSLFWQLPIPRDTYIFGSSALAFVIGALVIRADIATNRRPPGQVVSNADIGREYGGSVAAGSEQVSARMVDGSIFVSWSAPASSGGFPVLAYDVQASFDGGSSWQSMRHVPGSERAVMLDDLPGGSEVCFRIAAINAAGIGAPSRPTAPFLPMGLPGPVVAVPGHPGDGQVRLTWNAPLSDGGYPITDYHVQVSSDGGASWTDVPRQPSPECLAVASGLMNGHAYLFRVAAVNSRGRGRPGSPTQGIKPAGLPGPPFLQSYHGSDRSISLNWAPPSSDGGLPIIGYVIETSHDGGASWVLTDRADGYVTSTEITGLVNGIPYQVRVAALNSVGRGPASAPSSPVAPMGVPGVVGEVRVNAPGYGGNVIITAPARRRKPVARALLSVVLILVGAGLVGFAVMRTMQGDAIFRAGQSAQAPSPSTSQTAIPEGSTSNVPVEPDSSPPSAPSTAASPTLPAAPTSVDPAGSPVVEAPADSQSGQNQIETPVPQGEVIGTLAFYRAGTPILTESPYLIRQGVAPSVLEQGPGHYPSTPLPGTSGNSAIAGHRTGWGSPFLHLDQLAPGDEVVFTSVDGVASRYVVDSSLVVGPEETWVLGWDPLKAGMPTLTLTTCDPPNVNTRRLVVFARTAV